MSADDARSEAFGQMSLPSVPASVAAVRRLTIAACEAHGLTHLSDTAVLLASELATNALTHGAGQVKVVVTDGEGALRVAITDENPARPVLRHAGAYDEGGRGLALVDALASQWGVEPDGLGKTVWFTLAR